MADKSKLDWKKSSPGPSADQAKRMKRFAAMVQAMEDDEEDAKKRKNKVNQGDLDNLELER